VVVLQQSAEALLALDVGGDECRKQQRNSARQRPVAHILMRLFQVVLTDNTKPITAHPAKCSIRGIPGMGSSFTFLPSSTSAALRSGIAV
jgi:hypothetical protein